MVWLLPYAGAELPEEFPDYCRSWSRGLVALGTEWPTIPAMKRLAELVIDTRVAWGIVVVVALITAFSRSPDSSSKKTMSSASCRRTIPTSRPSRDQSRVRRS